MIDADQVRGAVLALSRPGEIFEPRDVAKMTGLPFDEVVVLLKLMTTTGELRNATAWNRAVRGFAPGITTRSPGAKSESPHLSEDGE